MTALIALLASTVLLIVWGGGIFPGAVCASAALCCAALALVQLRSPAASTPPAVPWIEISMLSVLAFVAFTALPLPPLLDPVVGPLRVEQNGSVLKALRHAASAGLAPDEQPWFALTRNRAGTLRAFLLFASAYGAAMLAASLPAAWKASYVRFLAVAGAIVALGGHAGKWWLPQGDTLWWTFPVPHLLPGPVGCFINRNHFGGFVAMLALPALALAVDAAKGRRWFVALFHALLFGVMAYALAFSLSRGALLAFALAGAVMVLFLALRRSVAAAALSLLAVAAVGAAVYSISNPHLRERLATLRDPLAAPSVVNRLSEWRETLRVIPHYPVIGAGANALRMVYPQYRETSSGRWLVHAENQYVELAAEGGASGVALALFCAGACVSLAWRNRRSAPDGVLAAAVGATLVALFHALFDFAILVPVVAVVVASLIGLLLPDPAAGSRRSLPLRISPALFGLAVAAFLGFRGVDDLQKLDAHEQLQTASPAELRRALVWAPTSWHAWYYLGRQVFAEGASRTPPDRRLFTLGEAYLTQAAWCDPMNYRLWDQVGRVRLSLGDGPGAEKAFERAKALRPWLYTPPIPGRR